MYVFDNQLCADDGRPIATFSSHWAACAAMLRQSDPTFKSLGSDKPEDLLIEAALFDLSTDGCPVTKAAPPNTEESRPYDPELDALESYNDAIRAIGERVKAGEPAPTTGYFGRKDAE